jgi:hypothetical protein
MVIYFILFFNRYILSGVWVRCGSNGHHQKKRHHVLRKEIGLSAQHLLTILGSIVSIVWGTCTCVNHLTNSIIFTFDTEWDIHTSSEIFLRQMAMDRIWNWQSSPTNCLFCIIGEVGPELKCPFKACLPYNVIRSVGLVLSVFNTIRVSIIRIYNFWYQ